MHADMPSIPVVGWMDAVYISNHQGIQFNIEITASSFMIGMEL